MPGSGSNGCSAKINYDPWKMISTEYTYSLSSIDVLIICGVNIVLLVFIVRVDAGVIRELPWGL